MGLLDNISAVLRGSLGQGEGASMPALIAAALAQTDLGNLQGLVGKLQEGGLGSQVQSWLGSGANLPVSASQIEAALGNDQVRQLAGHFGLPVDGVLKLLAEHVPTAVDQASPNGTLTG